MDGPRLLVFGDIHGAISTLRALLKRVAPTAEDTLLFLGDYIDRGEDSKAVLDYLISLQREYRCIFLKGNHEEMFLSATEGGTDDWTLWLLNGGLTTLRDFRSALPPHPYIAWLRALRTHHETDSHYFVHAGLRPGVPPAESTDAERLWMREPFLSSSYDWGKRIVFGHTMQLGGPLVRPNKIGIDTGACLPRVGRLTCLVLPAGEFVFSKGRTRRVE